MENNYCVYKHTAPNGKVYIGQTKQKPNARFQNGEGYKECPFFYKAIKKYGWENISHEILYDGLSAAQASKIEKEQIKKFNSNCKEYGYNLTDGGSAEYHLTEIGKEHRSAASKRMWKNEEYRQKKIESMTGKNNHMYGVKMSEESRKKMSESAKGRKKNPMSPETKAKLSAIRKMQGNFRTGAVLSEETKRKISESNKGKIVFVSEETKKKISIAMKGRTKSDKTKEKMRIAQQAIKYKREKPVVQLPLDGNDIIFTYKSAIDAANAVNASSSTMICRCCKGKLKKAYGYRWQYAI